MAFVRRLAYVSGTRADFGLMRRALLAIQQAGDFVVDVHVTGMHLDAAFGMTVCEVDDSGLHVASRTPGPQGHRDAAASACAIADALNGFTAAFAQSKPDAVLLLGDRGEMLAGAVVALHLGIPSIHIHGGERSGTVDEPVRHAISKLATEHWVATDESAARLKRMGEAVDSVFVMGAPGLIGIDADAEAGRAALSERLAREFGWTTPIQPFILGLFHPATAGEEQAACEVSAVLQASADLGLPSLWIGSNADAGSVGVSRVVDEWRAKGTLAWVSHLPRDEFCAAMKLAVAMVGNSSSGIIEAASWSTPVVNVGGRQLNRQRSSNTVDVRADRLEIAERLRWIVQKPSREPVVNVYGDGLTARRMIERLSAWKWPVDCAKLNAY